MTVENITKGIISHLTYCLRYRHSSAILISAAEQNVSLVMAEVVKFVAQNESWGETDPYSYSSFEVAKSCLYLKYNVLIDVLQKPMSHPDNSFMNFDVTGYNKVFYDLTLNASDPFFDTIKRDYYNEVSS